MTLDVGNDVKNIGGIVINRKYQLWTRIFIGVIIAIIIVFDVFIIIKGGTGTTISHELIMWAYQYPILPFALGVVFGHLFWRMPSTSDTAQVDPYVRELEESRTKWRELALQFVTDPGNIDKDRLKIVKPEIPDERT